MRKYISLLLLFSLAFGVSYAQVEEHKPMGSLAYHCFQKKLERQKTDKRRVNIAERKLKRKYISANQVFKSLEHFEADDYKLVFAKASFDKLSDKSNSLRICSAIENQAHYEILWDYMKEECVRYHVDPTDINSYTAYLKLKDRQKDKQYDTQADYHDYSEKAQVEENSTSSEREEEEHEEPEITEEDEQAVENSSETEEPASSEIVFPDFENYTGAKSCKDPMSEKEFYAFANAIVKIESDEEKAKIGLEYAEKFCFPTQYVMKISVFIKDQKIRYTYLKTVYKNIYDKENFYHAAQLLSDLKMKEEISQLK